MENNPKKPAGHEPTDVNTRPVWFAVLGTALGCVLIAFAVTLMFNMLHRRAGNEDHLAAENAAVPAVAESRVKYPGPRLQVAPETDLATLRAREDGELNHYGWIDKGSGIVRIPIDRAIELTALRGLPVNGRPGVPVPYRTTLDMQQARPQQLLVPAPTPPPK